AMGVVKPTRIARAQATNTAARAVLPCVNAVTALQLSAAHSMTRSSRSASPGAPLGNIEKSFCIARRVYSRASTCDPNAGYRSIPNLRYAVPVDGRHTEIVFGCQLAWS